MSIPARIVITGGPQVGKTCFARKLAEESRYQLLQTDALIGQVEWSEASRVIADEWFKLPGPWIVEGVSAVRALRKWIVANPAGKPCDLVYWGEHPHTELTKGQTSMLKSHAGMWAEIWQHLVQRGCAVASF